jgi:hypothetical protein
VRIFRQQQREGALKKEMATYSQQSWSRALLGGAIPIPDNWRRLLRVLAVIRVFWSASRCCVLAAVNCGSRDLGMARSIRMRTRLCQRPERSSAANV